MNAAKRQARAALGKFLGIDPTSCALPFLDPTGETVSWIYQQYEEIPVRDFFRVENAFWPTPAVPREGWPVVAKLLLRAAGLPLGTPAVVRRSGRIDCGGRMFVKPEPMPALRCATPEPGDDPKTPFGWGAAARRCELRCEIENATRDAASLAWRREHSADSPVRDDPDDSALVQGVDASVNPAGASLV